MVVDQDRVRDLFNYDPESGIVIRRMSQSGSGPVGSVVGSPDKDGYLVVRIDYKQYKLHRIIWLWMTGRWPDPEVDHENHIHDDNKWKNLRRATRLQNSRNRTISKNNTSGVCGVSWVKRDEKWRARIWVNGKVRHLLYTDDYDAAVTAREAAEVEYGFHQNHGEAA